MPIEQINSALERIISKNQDIDVLGTGFGTKSDPTEGPLWWKEGKCLLFSDIGNNRRMKWSLLDGVSVIQQGTNKANGLTRDPQGRLIACEHSARRVTRIEPDGSTTVVANNYRGLRLNRPNDVVVKSDGSIYFTDPMSSSIDAHSDLDIFGVYRVSPDLGTINLLVRDFVLPNGLAFSPDERTLYIDDTRRMHIRAFDLHPNGTLALATDRVFSRLVGERPGAPDGMKVDLEGNVYCTGPGGVWIIDPEGEHLGTIVTGEFTTNIGWGGEDWNTLFMTTWSRLCKVQMKIPGVPVPRDL